MWPAPHQSLPTAWDRQDRAAHTWGGRQICPGIFSLRLLTCACSQIYQFLAVVIFNGHIASYLTDLPFLASASPFTSGCWCVPVHPCVCSPGSSGESRVSSEALRPHGRVASGSSELLTPLLAARPAPDPLPGCSILISSRLGSSKGWGSWGLCSFYQLFSRVGPARSPGLTKVKKQAGRWLGPLTVSPEHSPSSRRLHTRSYLRALLRHGGL